MDAMDVLGALLGKKSRGGSAGGNILKDILGGRQPDPKQPQPTPRSSSRSKPSRSTQSQRPSSIGDAANSLEDLLGVSHRGYEDRQQQTSQESRQSPAPQRPRQAPTPAQKASLNAQSVVLIRAMVGAAKADGQITDQEQQQIVGQFGHLSKQEIDFLTEEFRRPVDAKDTAWNVPLGMEEQAYAMSLIAIDLDENKEAEYLADLAHGLRLSPAKCNSIHRKYNAPVIFRED